MLLKHKHMNTHWYWLSERREKPQSDSGFSWKWQMSAFTSENTKGVSYKKPTSPLKIASTDVGPHRYMSGNRKWKTLL